MTTTASLHRRRLRLLVRTLLAGLALALSAGVAPATAETINSCVVKDDGTVWCWGWGGEDGQLGAGSETPFSSSPVRVLGVDGAVDVAFREGNGCALLASGQVACWGRTYTGILALDDLGSADDPPARTGLARIVPGVDDARTISVGGEAACVVRADGRVVCWGCDGSGLAGDGQKRSCSPWQYDPSGLFTPAVVPGVEAATDVSVGDGHACAVVSGGAVTCWGTDENSGRLGSAHDDQDAHSPQQVAGVDGATAISVSDRWSCAIVAGGAVSCWGTDEWSGVRDDPHVPLPVAGLSSVRDLMLDEARACVILADRTVKCWGWVVPDMLGLADSISRTPVAIPGATEVAKLTGSSWAPCVIRVDGTVGCWGMDIYGLGASGRPFVRTLYDTGGPVAGLSDAVTVTTGDTFACGLRQAGAGVACVGLGPFRSEPAADEWAAQESMRGMTLAHEAWRIPGSEGANSVDAGGSIGCAVIGGTIKCLGKGARPDGGSLGGGVGVGDSLFVPVAVTGITDAEAVSVGPRTACALHSSGEVGCWGQTWDDDLEATAKADEPQPVTGLSGVTQLDAGDRFACAVHGDDGRVACWGDNREQVFGAASPSGSSTPIDVTGVSGAVEVTTAPDAVCARRGDGSVVCWGQGMTDEFGAGSPEPAVMDAITGADAVALDPRYTDSLCWVDGGQVHCLGQLADMIRAADGDFDFVTGEWADGVDEDAPAVLPGVEDAVSVAVLGEVGCVLSADGHVRCFGFAFFGLGDGRRPVGHGPAPALVAAPGLTGVRTGLPPDADGEHPADDPAADPAPAPDPQPADDPGSRVSPPAGPALLVPSPSKLPGIPFRHGPAIADETPPAAAAPAIVRGDKVVLTRFAVRRTGARCPKRVSARVSAGSHTRTLTTSRVHQRGRYCVLTVSLSLPKGAAKATSARFKVRGHGVRARIVKVKRRR